MSKPVSGMSITLRKAGAELVGTYALVAAGCGAIMVDSLTGALTHVGVALTFGLIITVMIAATGHLSGAHFNPAVTLAFALTRHFAWREVPLTAVLMFVIISVATDTRAVGELAALAIGATVALDALWGGPISGASMNPARSFGPALVAGVWSDQWIYWLAPLLGMCL